jgi:hypothetical protein
MYRRVGRSGAGKDRINGVEGVKEGHWVPWFWVQLSVWFVFHGGENYRNCELEDGLSLILWRRKDGGVVWLMECGCRVEQVAWPTLGPGGPVGACKGRTKRELGIDLQLTNRSQRDLHPQAHAQSPPRASGQASTTQEI